jgi:predicted transposase/invertase (TIGR01784 family)
MNTRNNLLRNENIYCGVEKAMKGSKQVKRISPTSDLAFKKTFGSVEHTDIISGLINDFFDIIAEDITIANPYSIDICNEFKDGEDINVLRQTFRDIAVSFKTAEFVSELQIKKTKFFDERSIYYPFKRFCDNYSIEWRMERGTDGKFNRFSSLRPVYALNILGYDHFDDDDSLRVFELYDHKRNKHFGKELLRIGYFELTKVNIETVNQRHWHDYFTTGEVKPEAPDYIKKASEIIEFTNLGEGERKVAEAFEKAQAIIDAEIVTSYTEGKAEGKAEGVLEGIWQAAKSMLQYGDPPEKVAECLKLPLDKVCQLQPQ